MENGYVLTPSDYIEIVGIVCSLLTSVIAIAISIKTLKQNSKMLEESSRPYIGIYGISTYMGFRQYYIILKNFGQSSAYINSFIPSYNLVKISKHDSFEPFSHIEGTTIMPGQSYRAAIDYDKVSLAQIEFINFSIQYSSGKRKYKEDFSLKINANIGNLEAHAPGVIQYANQIENKKLTPQEAIAETLQDMHIKSL